MENNPLAGHKPILPDELPAFDAAVSYEIPFIWQGNEISKNRLVLYDIINRKTVYDNIQSSIKHIHKIPANTLVNNNTYNARISVLDADDNESTLSDGQLLYCFSPPEFGLKNLTGKGAPIIIGSSVLETQVIYSQAEGEQLNNYQILLYDESQNLIHETKTYYYTIEPIKINGLSKLQTYYIRAVGRTSHKMPLDTGLIEFQVKYTMALSNTAIRAENIYENGSVRISSNIRTYGWKEENVLVQDSCVDLKNGYIDYNEGTDISDYFVLHFTVTNPNPNTNLLTFSNPGGDTVSIFYNLSGRPGIDNVVKAYIHLEVHQGILTYTMATPFFQILSPNNKLDIYLKRDTNHYYEVNAYIDGVQAAYSADETGGDQTQ